MGVKESLVYMVVSVAQVMTIKYVDFVSLVCLYPCVSWHTVVIDFGFLITSIFFISIHRLYSVYVLRVNYRVKMYINVYSSLFFFVP